jgi:hypothetical protein
VSKLAGQLEDSFPGHDQPVGTRRGYLLVDRCSHPGIPVSSAPFLIAARNLRNRRVARTAKLTVASGHRLNIVR